MAPKTAINPTRTQNYSEWYQQVVKEAELAEASEVRGCMVIKPWGYGLWENMQRVMDKMFKEKGVKNAYFPLLIPLRLLAKEAKHVDGFAKECAVVTHHRLEDDGKGGLKPAGKLEEPYIIRPTSETIIGETFAKWVSSYRDLPLLINQWANVMRWEMRTRLFLRTSEFLWQEGHTVHKTAEEANDFARQLLETYATFHEDYLAIPVIRGRKTEPEKFPGAEVTFAIESMMQDGKALQSATSHDLGQTFAKAANIQFQNEEGEAATPYTTSWGSTTRMIGSMIMVHGDDDGMIMPPRVAPTHIAILPIWKTEEDKEKVLSFCQELKSKLSNVAYYGRVIEVEIDERDIGNGPRKWQWVKKGVPMRLEIGSREVESGQLQAIFRHEPMNKVAVTPESLVTELPKLFDDMHDALYNRALELQKTNTQRIDNKDDFVKYFKKEGGFALAHWDGTDETLDEIKAKLGVTSRCLPFEFEGEKDGTCVWTGKPSAGLCLFAKAY